MKHLNPTELVIQCNARCGTIPGMALEEVLIATRTPPLQTGMDEAKATVMPPRTRLRPVYASIAAIMSFRNRNNYIKMYAHEKHTWVRCWRITGRVRASDRTSDVFGEGARTRSAPQEGEAIVSASEVHRCVKGMANKMTDSIE